MGTLQCARLQLTLHFFSLMPSAVSNDPSSPTKVQWKHLTIAFNLTPELLNALKQSQPKVISLGLTGEEKTLVQQHALPSPAGRSAGEEWNGAFDSKFVELALKGDPHVMRVIGTAELTLNRDSIECTGAFAMEAMRHCERFDIEVPRWLLRRFVEIHERVANFEVAGYDEAMGYQPMTTRKREALASRASLRRAVSLTLADELYTDPDMPIDMLLFETVGERFGIGASKCREIYEEAVAEGGYELPSLKRFLRAYRAETGSLLPMPSVVDVCRLPRQ